MSTAETAVRNLKRGKIIIITDAKTRENEGDLVMAAEFATAKKINFMITHGRGLVCLPLTRERARALHLPLMARQNTSRFRTNFTVSIDAKTGITTGIPAGERALTIRAVVNSKTKPSDLARPGHVFPIIAHPKGLAGRQGHTEASVDLMRLAGLAPIAVVCEILAPDGRSARGQTLTAFAKKFKLPIISIAQIIAYKKSS